MSDPLSATAAALYTTLTGGTALTSLLAGTTSVYDTQAPDGASLPYVVFSHAGGGPDNLNASNLENDVWFIRAYTTSGMKAAYAIREQVDALVHKHNLSTTGWRAFWCCRETSITGIENPPDGVRVYAAGGLYRIRLAKS
jgi:hypothetical protein